MNCLSPVGDIVNQQVTYSNMIEAFGIICKEKCFAPVNGIREMTLKALLIC